MFRALRRLDPSRRRRRRALTACLAVGLALTGAGCASGGSGASAGASNSGPPMVTGEQVVTACFHAYFYNGIL
ncbi:MAG TPA: hypothetical protein VFN36_07810, partial [Solirubrobacteraceae bacterium]|nr:hypothetical protein [Solirubrobacteraceae bacterium]